MSGGKTAFFQALTADNGINMVKFFKRMIGVVKTLFVAVVKDFVGQRLNCVVNSLKSGVVVGIEIVFCFFLYKVMVSRNDFCRFVGGVGIAFFFKVAHNARRRLIKAFVGQNASLTFIVTINNHDITSISLFRNNYVTHLFRICKRQPVKM